MMTEEEKRQRMMAQMMRRGMNPGMGGGQQQEFGPAPEAPPPNYDVVPIEMMKDTSKLITGKGKRKKKIDPNDPNADILETHGMGGNSVGGGPGGTNQPNPNVNPAMEGRRPPPPNVPMPEAVRKKKWPWE
jgi:hypothetical protein